MAHFEAHHKNGWGMALDYGFMDLGADIAGPFGGFVDTKVRQGVLEALLIRRARSSGNSYLDYFGGIRWWDNDVNVVIDAAVLPGTVANEIKEDWLDIVVGLRWSNSINEKWNFVFRGDIGGLGVKSDFTSSISSGFKYRISESMELDLQYKAMWVDYEAGSPGQPGYFRYDTATHGPIFGVIFGF